MTTKNSGVFIDKRREYGEAFKAEALRLASESRSTQVVSTAGCGMLFCSRRKLFAEGDRKSPASWALGTGAPLPQRGYPYLKRLVLRQRGRVHHEQVVGQ